MSISAIPPCRFRKPCPFDSQLSRNHNSHLLVGGDESLNMLLGQPDLLHLLRSSSAEINHSKTKKRRGGSNPLAPRRDAPQMHDRCDLICPDLPKVI